MHEYQGKFEYIQGKTFMQAEYDILSSVISVVEEMQNRIPVAYKGRMYYAYDILPERLELVAFDEVYLPDKEDELLRFKPRNVVYVSPNDPDIDYLKMIINSPENQVKVAFVEIFSLPENKMQIRHDGGRNYNDVARTFEYNVETSSYILKV